MKIKSYSAESVAEALKRVRSEMGANAYLLKTRKLINPLGMERVEVTACTDEDLPSEESPDSNKSMQTVETVTTQSSKSEPNSPATKSETLADVHRRLDSIDRKLAALILQLNEMRQN